MGWLYSIDSDVSCDFCVPEGLGDGKAVMSIYHKVSVINFYEFDWREVPTPIGCGDAYPASLGVGLQRTELIIEVVRAVVGAALDLFEVDFLKLARPYLAHGRSRM